MFNFKTLLVFIKKHFIFLTVFFLLSASFLLNLLSDQAGFFSQTESADSKVSEELSQLLSAPFSNESLSLAFELRKNLDPARLELEKFILICLWQNQRFKDFAPRARAYLMVEKDTILSYLLYSLGENNQGQVDSFKFSWYDRLKFFFMLKRSGLTRLGKILFFTAILLLFYALIRIRFKSGKSVAITRQIALLPTENSVFADTGISNRARPSQNHEKSMQKIESSEKSLNLPITRKSLELKESIAYPQKKKSQGRELIFPGQTDIGRFIPYTEQDFEKCKEKFPAFSISAKNNVILYQSSLKSSFPLRHFDPPGGLSDRKKAVIELVEMPGFEKYSMSFCLKSYFLGITEEFSIISCPWYAQIITGSFTKLETSQEESKYAELEGVEEFLLPARFEAKALTDVSRKEDLANFRRLIEALHFTTSQTDPIGITSSSDITNLATFVIDLGRALTEKKRKVLLIDLDFANPKLNHFTNEPCLYSLKDFLKNQLPDESFFIKSIIENIFILHSGISTEQNLALINNELFWKRVFEFARRYFDNLLIMLPDLNQLGKLKLHQEKISYLVLINETSTRSRFEFLDAWIPLRNYDMKHFIRLKCHLAS